MVTVEDLKECIKLDLEINAIEEMIDGLRLDKQKITTNYDALCIQNSKQFDIADLVDIIFEMSNNLAIRQSTLVKLKSDIYAAINRLSDVRYRTVLINRYLNGLSWEEIAKCMNYGFDYVFELHRKALKEFERTQ